MDYYKQLIKDMTWSYSRISCFYDCPYRFFLKYIYGCSDEERFFSSYGSFMHKLIEDFYNDKINRDEMKAQFLFGFSSEVKGERPNSSIAKRYIKNGLDYIENFKPFPYKKVAVEDKYSFRVGKYSFIGYLDYVGRNDTGYYIIDNKSRDLKPRSRREKPTQNDKLLDSMLRQLYLYSSALKERYGEFPQGLCFNCFRTNTFIKEQFHKQAYEDTIKWAINSIEEIQNADSFPPNIDYFKCRYICGVNHECCYFEERR